MSEKQKMSNGVNKIAKISIISAILFFVFCIPSSFADSLDQSETFNVDSNYDFTKRTKVVATLRHIGERSYFYIEDKWWSSLNSYQKSQAEKNIRDLSNEFDEIIYPKLIDFFGNVWDPGIDNDSRITILMTKLKVTAGGYFDSCNVYVRSRCSRSNEREMLHINVGFIANPEMKSFAAHELQHLINWNQKERIAILKEDVWLNELRSEYIPSLLGYNDPYSESLLEMRVNHFLADPYNPLGEWKGMSSDYGVIALFGQYLANQFGENLFSLMSKNHLVGITSINRALEQAGYSENFDEVFTNWSFANYYNSLAIGRGGKYGYTNTNLKRIHISPTVNRFYSYGIVSFSERVKDWSPRWYLFQNELSSQDGSIALKIEFESSNQGTNFKVPYMINYRNGEHELGFVNLEEQEGTAYIFNFAKDVESILVVPANHSKTANFTIDDSSFLFTLKASTVIAKKPVEPSIADGSLIRAKGDYKVYIIQKGYKRHILDSRIFDFYGHLNWENIIEVTPQERDFYKDSAWVRAVNNKKVYEVNGDKTKHWLNMTAEEFYVSGRRWEAVFIINNWERDFYRTGVDVQFR